MNPLTHNSNNIDRIMLKTSMLRLWRWLLWLAAAALSIIITAALVIHFWVMPNIGQYKNSIATYASNTLNQKISIGDIKASWHGINPELSIDHIDIFDAENRIALQLNNVHASFSWLSIPMLEPRLDVLAIQAPELTVRRIASGEVFVAGISMRGASKPALPNWLLRQNTVEVSEARVLWIDEKRGAPPLSLDHFNLSLHSPLWRGLVKNHHFKIHAVPSAGTAKPLVAEGSFYGDDVSNTREWNGTATLTFTNTNLAAFKNWIDYPVDILSGTGSTTLKADFSAHAIQSVSARVDIQDLQLQTAPNAPLIQLNSLSGQIVWESLRHWKNLAQLRLPANSAATTGYNIRVDGLSASNGSGLNIQNLNADYTNTDTGKQHINLNIAKFGLAGIHPYITLLPLPDVMQQHFSATSPQGMLEDVTLDWGNKDNNAHTYRIQAKFNQLAIHAHQKIPGLNNMSGVLKATQKSGQLQLNAINSTFDSAGIFRWPIPIDRLIGDINWTIKDNITDIQISSLNVSNAHLSGTLSGHYKMDSIKGGYLDLESKFDRGNAKYALNYYPVMLGEATLHWLDTSILAGEARDINLIVKGRLADFPFVDANHRPDPSLGAFKVSARLDNLLLEYGTGWPTIDHLGLNLLFEGKRMELNADAGHILGNRIVKSKAIIAQLDANEPVLSITSEVTGPVSEGIHFINKSPVLDVTQGFTEGLRTSGNGKLALGLMIPMQNLDATKYKGIYQITNASMESPNIARLNHVNGILEFTESSLSAKNIKADMFGSPLAFNLNSGKDKIIRIAAKGKITEDSLKQIFKEHNMEQLSNYLSGGTEWTGNALIQKPRVTISLRSNLIGIGTRFPAPLEKSIEQPLEFVLDKKQDASNDTLRLALGNKISARIFSTMENGRSKFQRAEIKFNPDNTAGTAITPAMQNSRMAGISLMGKLDYLDADAWRYTLKNILGDDTAQNAQGTQFVLQQTALTINALDIFDRRINQLKISNSIGREGLAVNVQSREISGDVQWISHNNGKLVARLSNLTIPDKAPDKLSAIKDVDTSSTQQFIKLDQDYPALDVTADNFEFNKKSFGALELVAYPQNDNWNIQKIKFSSPDSVMSAEGQWNNWIRSPNTFLNVSWDIKDLGNTLKRFGYPDTVKEGAGELKGRLHWPGSPTQFDTTRLNGELEFEVRKGQILQVQPGMGRLLGLLSLQSLPRRLTLDFRDLFSNGFAFDKINATVKISQGVMRSNNFVMSGPAADVEIKGETNLQKETQHLFVKVMPRISDSLSLAALAGGPLAGAVAFLAQKVLKDPLNKIVSSEYEITGTWDSPQEVKPAVDDNKQQGTNLISPKK